MPLPAAFAARIGRVDLNQNAGTTGTYVDSSTPSNVGFGLSGSFGTDGRDGLILLAIIIAGIAAFSYWTR